MTKEENVAAARHGSTASSASWRSQDTVRGSSAGRRGTPVKVSTDKESPRVDRDSEISPGSHPPPGTAYSKNSIPSNIAPWEQQQPKNPEFGNYRRDLAVLEPSRGRIPSISRQPPSAMSTAAPWNINNGNGGVIPSSVFGNSFYNDSSEDVGQLSPGFRPSSSNNDDYGFPGEDRRPSIASATTVSSTGSKSSASRGFHKKLQGFFGEDFPGFESRQNSDASLPPGVLFPPNDPQRARNRTNSVSATLLSTLSSRPASPSSASRPRTPMASSEVTPWEFQELDEPPAVPEKPLPSSDQVSLKSNKSHTHKLHLPGHRHTRSKEEPRASDQGQAAPLRPTASREESVSNFRREDWRPRPSFSSGMSSRSTLVPRAPSPTPSAHSMMARDQGSQRSPITPAGKRSIFDKIRRHKHDKASPDSLRDLPSSTASLPQTGKLTRPSRAEPSVPGGRKKAVDNTGRTQGTAKDAPRREHGRLPFKSRKGTFDGPVGKDPNSARVDVTDNDAIWQLDTDLSHMEGIVSTQAPPMTPNAAEIFSGWPPADEAPEVQETETTAAWDAPDSWAVKRIGDENISRLQEVDENGMPAKEENIGPPYCVRIFRADSTFAVVSVGLNTTAAELIQILGKKTFLQDELGNYQIIMRKLNASRQLEPQERPLLIQKRLLEQAGYTDADRIEDVGREDNSYLCRFTFLPARMSGFSSLEKDPGFSKLQKFSHIDLSGRNLITIPITLYQKATEIISLNLSRNLALDVPKDFIQACTNLREIKYTSNEAWRLPKSMSLATRLTMLDISNNRLEQLEHADLHRLQSLVSLKLSNNKLSLLPKYLGSFRTLRSLNISSNNLMEFPEFLCDITTLVDLDVSFNAIRYIPKIEKLVNLERLWATNNRLSGPFVDQYRNLVSLREIDVRFNAVDNIDILSELPKLEYLMAGHNSVSTFERTFPKLRVLHLNHNPVTRFSFAAPVPSLSSLNLASAKLGVLPDDLWQKIPGLTKLILDKNHFSSLSGQIGILSKLEHLSIAKNSLSNLPNEVGNLQELRYLDVRENNMSALPSNIWLARKLETLNVSSNVLDTFPKALAGVTAATSQGTLTPAATPGTGPNPSYEELGKQLDYSRRPSVASSSYLGAGSPSHRKASVSSEGRKPSVVSRTPTEGTITPNTSSRKDSSYTNRLTTTFAGSLRHLFLADNRLSDEVFDELIYLPELRILNLSYNDIYDLPPRTLRRWQQMAELYLSGNGLSSLPAEDLEEVSSLKVLHINNNKFQVLPAELAKIQKLAIMDIGSNLLKYNVCNWPYDWNWNWNHQLKYLNMSGNKRLEIKPSGSYSSNMSGRVGKDLTDFTALTKLRVLGLMDVTLMVPSVPDQTENRRVRTAGSSVGSMTYGLADSLGRHDHLSTMDLVIPNFRSHHDETILGMFDGQALPNSGSKIAKFLYENFKHRFSEELERLRPTEGPGDALRRTYLGLNKELATAANQNQDKKSPDLPQRGNSIAIPDLAEDDLHSGSVATVLYLKEMDLFVSNVGDVQALLIHSEGGHRIITRKHDPAEPNERQRIREAGGYVSRQGKLNDILEVSRAFGYFQMAPSVIAAPHISQITLKESDEMVLLASRELWDYLTPDFAVDVARSERSDLMRAAQKLRDLAIAFGATGKIMVMMIGVSDLRRRERARFRTHSMSMGPSGQVDDPWVVLRRGKRGRDGPADSKLARLDQEVDAPTGDVSLVFTDIKNSTLLWETYPIPMRSAIRQHNETMRRHLRIIGGYEVKTEGDAFMVAFPTVTSALLWCFTIQGQLLDVPWPQEILSSVNGQEVLDADGNVIFRGLSVRMGIHWGQPVCEVDPVTKRMDYFGPMVNRASRISSVADGGQITVSSDFIAEIQRLLETHIESDRSGSTGSEDTLNDDFMSHTIRRELRSLSSQGFEVKDLGERRLKGLENPEYIYLMYPHSLASRLIVQQQRAEAEAAAQGLGSSSNKAKDSQLTIDLDHVWQLWSVALRLEMLCSTLECPGATQLKAPETALLERMKSRGGEITDRFLLNFVEHQISRIETCVTTLELRNLVRPFKSGLLSQACSMIDIMQELKSSMQELETLRSASGGG